MNVMGVVAAVALLVGCNDGDKPQPPSEQHVQMTKICVANGGDAAHCECQATKLDELLDASEIDPAVYKAEAFMALDYDSRFKQSTLAGEAMVSCDTAEPPAGQ
jgi:hypothetical protein